MGSVKKKIISIIMSATIISSLTFSSLPAERANASENTEITTRFDNGVLTSLYSANAASSNAYNLCNNVKDGAILHAWCWSFNSIKENLKDIAEAGFTAVQTSPANQCLPGHNGGMRIWSDNDGKWEFHYQPTDWKIGNYQLGSREDFIAMCDEADKYGVKIIVDVLPNHTTTDLGSVSQELKNAAGGQDKLYHEEGFNNISQWEVRFYCTNGAVLNLPDVNTENPGFQKYYLNYLNDLIDCGVDGFRYDTAKHIGLPDDPPDRKTERYGWKNNFWNVALGNESVDGVSLHNKDKLFIYGEVLQSDGSRDEDYGKIFELTASSYGYDLRSAVKSYNFNGDYLKDWRNAAGGNRLVTWVESHDTYCNDGKSVDLQDWQIRACWAVIAARKEGTPLFFSRPDGSNGWSNRWGNNTIGPKGNDQFKDPEVAAVNKFRNAMVGQSEYLRNYNGNHILSIERGNKGQVIINLGDSTRIDNCETNLANGSYKDAVSGRTYDVINGKISGQLDKQKIVVLYDEPNPIASVSANPGNNSGSYSFKGESISVKLSAINTTNATYSIDGGSSKTYTNGTEIEIGKGLKPGETTTLTLNGSGSNGNVGPIVYKYTKLDSSVKAGYLYATKPSGWGSTMYAYIYDESAGTAKTLEKWPGVKMSGDGSNFYYELPSEWQTNTTRVIFNDGNNQCPESKQPGELYVSGKAMNFENGKISLINPTVVVPELEISSNALSVSNSSPYIGDEIEINSEAATGGSGDITYQIDVDGDIIQSYSSSRTASWIPKEVGTYTIKVTAKDSKNKMVSATIKVTVSKKTDIFKINEVGTSVDSPQLVGKSIKLTIYGIGAEEYRFVALASNGRRTEIQSYSTNNTATWTPKAAGTYKLYFKAKDAEGNEKQMVIKYVITSNLAIDSVTSSVVSPIVGSATKINIDATGASYYKFVLVDSKGNKTTLQNYKKNSTITWKPKSAGTFKIYGKAKDASGKEVSKCIKVTVVDNLKITSIKTSVASPQDVGTAIKLRTVATGAKQYSFTVKNSDGKSTVLKSYSTSSSAIWTPSEVGNYTLIFKAKNSLGEEVEKTMTYTVEAAKEVKVNSVKTNVSSPVVSGTSVKITASATSLSRKTVYYKYFIHNGINGWKCIKDTTTSKTATWKPTKSGKYYIMVQARDKYGNADTSIVEFNVK